jgi:hypothetical protein
MKGDFARDGNYVECKEAFTPHPDDALSCGVSTRILYNNQDVLLVFTRGAMPCRRSWNSAFCRGNLGHPGLSEKRQFGSVDGISARGGA